MNADNRTTSWKSVWRVLYPLLTYEGIIYLINTMAEILLLAAVIREGDALPVSIEDYLKLLETVLIREASWRYELLMIAAAVTLPILILYIRMDRKRLYPNGNVPVPPKVEPIHYIAVALAGLSACYVVNNLMLASGLLQADTAYAEAYEQVFQGKFALEILGVGILIPIVEELIFRKLMYGRMKEFLPVVWAGVLSSICFGLTHGTMVQSIYSFLLALMMVYFYEKFQDIKAPILVHMISNLIAVISEETGFLDGIYANTGLFYGSTCVMAVVLAGSIYWVMNRVKKF